jgi:hypothetical protein
MSRFPNFKGAAFLGFCLNVLGLVLVKTDKRHDRDSKALKKAILSWTKTKFAWLHSYNPREWVNGYRVSRSHNRHPCQRLEPAVGNAGGALWRQS